MPIDNEDISGGINMMDIELRDRASVVLKKMKKLEKEFLPKMKFKRLSKTTIVASTSEENLKTYEKIYGKL